MGNKRFGGPKYANGNHKSQQKAYNRTKHGLKIRVAANKADQETKKNGTGKKGDGKDVAHKNGNPNDNRTSNLVAQSKSKNRSYSRTKNAKKRNPRA